MPPSHPAEIRLDRALLGGWPMAANERGDKHERGTVVVVGGSRGTPGAMLLAGAAALRMGAGRLQIATAPEVATSIAVAMPEALVIGLDPNDRASLVALVAAADAVVVGPGLADLDEAAELVALTLDQASPDAVIVFDALGITALPVLRSRLAQRPSRVTVTPNREELESLLDGRRGPGRPERVVAAEYGLTVVSFGCVAGPDGTTWVDPVGVTGLGTSGAGDVLAGAVGGAGARCHDAAQAACWATLCHRLAATRLAAALAPVGYLARELADEIAPALAELADSGRGDRKGVADHNGETPRP